ncbi:DUF6085 family protein [Streptomyces halstedii]|uniref:DUF6085 family protein n=1 Tax=Streptomyces halstedii TaxID=1944 RepID=UPI003805C883
MLDVQGRCPACGAVSLFLGEGGHVTCSRADCPAPDAADELLHGLEDGVLRLFRGDFGTRLILRALEANEPRPSEAQLAADAKFLANIQEDQVEPFREAFSSFRPAPSRAGDVLAALGRRIPETLAKGIDRDDYALTPSASEPPVVGTARIQLDVTSAPSTQPPRCSCGQTTRLLSVDSAGGHWHEVNPAVSVPPEAFDRLVRVAMWVSRGQSMAHTPDPSPLIGARYPDAAARKALGALDDVGLLDTYREKASGRPAHPDGTPYRYHEIVAGGWRYCDGCHAWGEGWTAENPHDCPGTYVKGPTTEEAPDA